MLNLKKHYLFIISQLILFLVCLPALAETGFLDSKVQVGKTNYHYQIYVPPNWKPNLKLPVILFLHGAGERGNDGLEQLKRGMAPAIINDRSQVPALVVMPQVPKLKWWSDLDMEKLALKSLNKTIKQFNGDSNRIYLTGLSMGGHGVWHLASKYPNKFKALAPVCGRLGVPNYIKPNKNQPIHRYQNNVYLGVAKSIGKKPIWIFHSSDDPIVPVSESRKMVKAFDELGIKVKYTEYSDLGHNAWEKAYFEPNFFDWLLSH